MTNAHTIVLLGGSGLGPWAWGRVTPILNARGFRPLTPELRATGDDTTPAPEVSLVDWIDDVTDFLVDQDQDDVTLVAHSFAGYVAAGVLARDTSQIRTAVFLDAVLPQPGKSWFDVMGPAVERLMSGLASNGAIPWFTREQLDQLYPGNSIGDDDFSWMQSSSHHSRSRPTHTQPPLSRSTRSARGSPMCDAFAPRRRPRTSARIAPAGRSAPSTPGTGR
jgi:pimeloyl-ACP methyl ester carboxylesterase